MNINIEHKNEMINCVTENDNYDGIWQNSLQNTYIVITGLKQIFFKKGNMNYKIVIHQPFKIIIIKRMPSPDIISHSMK
mgnify:CR=1 FL=1